MEKQYYPVYTIDICFESYATDYIWVGAEDTQHLLEWLFSKESGYKFNKAQKKEIKDSLKGEWSRARKLKHVWTDTPYKVLESFGYYE